MSATAIDLPVSSPVGELRYRPAPPWADEGPNGMRLQWQPDHFGCFEAAAATMLGVDFRRCARRLRRVTTRKREELAYLARFDAWLADRGYRRRDVPITRDAAQPRVGSA